MNAKRKAGMPLLRCCLVVYFCFAIFTFECASFLPEQNVEISSQVNENRVENGSSTTSTEVSPFSNVSETSEAPFAEESNKTSIISDAKNVPNSKESDDHSVNRENNKHKDKTKTRSNRTKSKPQHPSVFVVPDEGADVVFKCTDENDAESTRVRAWVLPNGQVLRPPPEPYMEKQLTDEGVTAAVDSGITVTKYELRIETVRLGMDGRYMCVMYAKNQFSPDTVFDDNDDVNKETLLQSANYSRRNFFIPYIVSRGGFPQAAILSLAISVGFCVVCVGIICADRHLRRRRGDLDDDDFVEYYARQQQRNAASDGASAAWRAASFGSDFGYYGGVGSTDRLTYGALAMRRKTQVWSTGGEFGFGGYVDGILAEENDEEMEEEWKRRAEEQAKYFTRSISTIGFDEIPKKTKSEEVAPDEKKAEVGNELEVPSNNVPTYSPLQTSKTQPKFAFNADIVPAEDDEGGNGELSAKLDYVETTEKLEDIR